MPYSGSQDVCLCVVARLTSCEKCSIVRGVVTEALAIFLAVLCLLGDLVVLVLLFFRQIFSLTASRGLVVC